MRFSEYINSWKPYEVSDMFEKEINNLGSFLLTHNYEFLLLMALNWHSVWELFWLKHIAKLKERVEGSIFRSTIKCKDYGISHENEPTDLYLKMAYVWWNNEAFGELFGDMPIEDLSWFKSENTPVLIEETYEIDGPQTRS